MQPNISDEYIELNRELHERNTGYGCSGQAYAQHVDEIAEQIGTKTILDYGCGKQTLSSALPQYRVIGYDPCLEGLDDPPEPCDLVVCTDVLEHIEPDYLDNVLDDLKRVTRGVGFFTIATIPAKKFLRDGRNAHLIVEEMDWWLPKIMERFKVSMIQNFGRSFLVIVEAK